MIGKQEERIMAKFKVYYTIELNEIVEAHRKAGTFGFEEVATAIDALL